MKNFQKFINKSKFLFPFFKEKPHSILSHKRVKFSELLPYEDVYKTGTREIFILQPTAVCCGWELEGIYHELEDNKNLEEKIDLIMDTLNSISDERITIQIITDKGRDYHPDIPNEILEPKTIAQKICRIQYDHLANNFGKLMKTKLYFFLRIDVGNFNVPSKFTDDFDDIYKAQLLSISDAIDLLEQSANTIEMALGKIINKKIACESLKYFIKKWTHSTTDFYSEEVQEYMKHDSRKPLREQIAEKYIEFAPHAISLNNQIIQGLSWKNIPTNPKIKTMIPLLSLEENILICVSMRPSSPGSGQIFKRVCLGKRDENDIEKKELDDLINEHKKGKTLWETSIHLLIRYEESEGMDLDSVKYNRKLKQICESLFNDTRVTWIQELDNFPILYLSCLPFIQNKYMMKFIGRSYPIIGSDFAPYFLAYSSFKGTGIEHAGMAHINRANELIYVNSRVYEFLFNQHLAVFGISGGGKSVLTVYDILAEVAYNNSYVFIIDSQTSCEILARVLSFQSKAGVSINKPPEKFPNPFSGEIDEDRAKVIVSIISSSLNILTSEVLDPKESTLLVNTILFAYNQVKISSQSVFQVELEKLNADFETIESSKIFIDKTKDRRSLKMQDVISCIAEVGAIKNDKQEVIYSLKDKLSPFYGSGQLSKIFDQDSYEKDDEETPCVTIYDLCELQRQPVLLTIATQVITNEVMRHIYMPKNKGRCGIMVIDEAGVNLGGGNEELAKFVENAFAVLRKKRVKCVGIDNNMDRFTTERALKAIWEGSESKIILAMGKRKDLAEKFVFGKKDIKGNYIQAPLITENRYVKILPSLDKLSGKYADILFHGNAHKGTFTFAPCGVLYWLSVNKDVEKSSFYRVVEHFGSINDFNSVWNALMWLAEKYPSGKINEKGDPIPVEDNDLDEDKENNFNNYNNLNNKSDANIFEKNMTLLN